MTEPVRPPAEADVAVVGAGVIGLTVAYELLRRGRRVTLLVVPGIYDLAVAELSVGFRPAVRDHLPVIGAAPVPGLFVATGHFRNGILLAPATGHYLAELMVSGDPPPALTPFGVERLGQRRPAAG